MRTPGIPVPKLSNQTMPAGPALISWITLPIVLLLVVPLRAGEPAQPLPWFSGSSVPTPPRQTDPWKPPRCDIPEVHIKAARLLFDAGLTDPRGCDYHAVSIVARDFLAESSSIS